MGNTSIYWYIYALGVDDYNKFSLPVMPTSRIKSLNHSKGDLRNGDHFRFHNLSVDPNQLIIECTLLLIILVGSDRINYFLYFPD